MMCTRSPPNPRTIGRLAPGPKLRLAMPGSSSSASPMLPGASRAISNASTVETALNARSVASAPTVASAVTVTSSRSADRLSTKSMLVVSPAVTATVCRPLVSCSRCAVTSYEPAGTLVNSKVPLSVNVNAPVPRIRMTAPSTGPPFSTRVTVPRSVPPSPVWASAGAAASATAAAMASRTGQARRLRSAGALRRGTARGHDGARLRPARIVECRLRVACCIVGG